MLLEAKSAVITGAGRGMGRALVVAFLKAGCGVVAVDIDGETLADLNATAKQTGAEMIVTQTADASDNAAARQAVGAAIQRWGHLDILVNAAGIIGVAMGADAPSSDRFWDVSPTLYRRFLEVNTMAAFVMSAEAVRHMQERNRGRIITVTTSLGTMLKASNFPYGASKAANEAQMSSLAAALDEAGVKGVTANVLVPGGPVDTRMVATPDGESRAHLLQPEVLVPPALWLASDASDGISGIRIVASKWDATRTREENLAAAGAPIGWPGLQSATLTAHAWPPKNLAR